MVAAQWAKQGRTENDGADEKQEIDGYDEEEGEGMATVKKEKGKEEEWRLWREEEKKRRKGKEMKWVVSNHPKNIREDNQKNYEITNLPLEQI